jgi:hypothetical protein
MSEIGVPTRRLVLIPFLLLAAVGCGSGKYGSVTGKVTLDGQPLAGATVQFQPVQPGSPSFAVTDSSGNYELIFSRDIEGAEVGEHVVSITTAQSADPDADPPQAEVPEKVPEKYNVKSELKETVERGSNTFDFDLQSK